MRTPPAVGKSWVHTWPFGDHKLRPTFALKDRMIALIPSNIIAIHIYILSGIVNSHPEKRIFSLRSKWLGKWGGVAISLSAKP